MDIKKNKKTISILILTIIVYVSTFFFACNKFNKKEYKYYLLNTPSDVIAIEILYRENSEYVLIKEIDVSFAQYIYDVMDDITYSKYFTNGHWDRNNSYVIKLKYNNGDMEFLKYYCPTYQTESEYKKDIPINILVIQNVADYNTFNNMVLYLLLNG